MGRSQHWDPARRIEKLREKIHDERLGDQPSLKVSIGRDVYAGGRVLDFALLFEGGTDVPRDSERFP